ncbi:MAG: hypothetical protein ACO22Y_00240 [Sediminibacterium sp.]
MMWIIGILGGLTVVSLFAVYNLLVKLEKYEDVVEDQVQYLNNISKSIYEAKMHLQQLDEKGVFQSDDEVGYFFQQLQNVQEELNRYMLPENYGKEKSKQ